MLLLLLVVVVLLSLLLLLLRLKIIHKRLRACAVQIRGAIRLAREATLLLLLLLLLLLMLCLLTHLPQLISHVLWAHPSIAYSTGHWKPAVVPRPFELENDHPLSSHSPSQTAASKKKKDFERYQKMR